jgi:hypothetical protein
MIGHALGDFYSPSAKSFIVSLEQKNDVYFRHRPQFC